MMSANDIKMGKPDRRRIPHEGTTFRKVFDLFVAFKYEPLTVKDIAYVCDTSMSTVRGAIYRLIDDCDMEIISPKRAIYVFVGFINRDGLLVD